MTGDVPLITLVKREEIAERPSLSEEDLSLENTLSMLCSFLTLEDFISFLSTPMFASYAQREEPWVVFEIGLKRPRVFWSRTCGTVKRTLNSSGSCGRGWAPLDERFRRQ